MIVKINSFIHLGTRFVAMDTHQTFESVKTIIIVVILLSFSLTGCEKSFLVPKKDLPGWLIDNINAAEKEIAENPKSIAATGSWLRTEWNGEYYYEYFNGLSSSMSMLRDHDGGIVNILVGVTDPAVPYYSEKCCSKCVWKGPYGICND